MTPTSIPNIGLGTFRLTDDQVRASLLTGLELGYRHIDSAQVYGTESAVGAALAESGVPRDALFVTTKIWTENLGCDRLIPSLREAWSGCASTGPTWSGADPLAVPRRCPAGGRQPGGRPATANGRRSGAHRRPGSGRAPGQPGFRTALGLSGTHRPTLSRAGCPTRRRGGLPAVGGVRRPWGRGWLLRPL